MNSCPLSSSECRQLQVSTFRTMLGGVRFVNLMPFCAAILMYQYWLFQRETADQGVQEHATVLAAIGFEIILMALMQAFQLRSAYLFSNMAIIGLVPLLFNEAYNSARNKTASVSFGLFHWLWTALSMSMLVEASTNVSVILPCFGVFVQRLTHSQPPYHSF